jgi:hypothetical protein
VRTHDEVDIPVAQARKQLSAVARAGAVCEQFDPYPSLAPK